MIPMRGATPTLEKSSKNNITNENINKKHEDYEWWHEQSRERNQVQCMSMSKVVSNKVK